MQEVGWPSLSSRREQHKLILFYKINTGIYPQYIRRFIPAPVVNRYPLRDVGHIPNIHTRLVSSGKSFFPSTIKLWNKLPAATVRAPTLSTFKNSIKNNHTGRVKYYTACTGRAGIWLSRLRMGLSALCQHRFTYNLVEDASCPSCGHRETTSHYLFYCPAYAVPRAELYDNLASLNLDINNKILLQQTILYGTDTNQEQLLKFLFKFLTDTQRFV